LTHIQTCRMLFSMPSVPSFSGEADTFSGDSGDECTDVLKLLKRVRLSEFLANKNITVRILKFYFHNIFKWSLILGECSCFLNFFDCCVNLVVVPRAKCILGKNCSPIFKSQAFNFFGVRVTEYSLTHWKPDISLSQPPTELFMTEESFFPQGILSDLGSTFTNPICQRQWRSLCSMRTQRFNHSRKNDIL